MLQGHNGLVDALFRFSITFVRGMIWPARVAARLLPCSLGRKLAPPTEIIERLLTARVSIDVQWIRERV